jgi:hypothetical protein
VVGAIPNPAKPRTACLPRHTACTNPREWQAKPPTPCVDRIERDALDAGVRMWPASPLQLPGVDSVLDFLRVGHLR